MKKVLRIGFALLLPFLFIGSQPEVVDAHHSWSNYHWARSNNPAVVTLGNNVSSQWTPYLLGAAYYWNRSSVLDVPVVTGGVSPSVCPPTYGRVQVCNASYGNNGWMGLAQLWVSGNHITQATVRLNDTYFNTSRFNTPAWRNLVMCQEVGHGFGLAHQDVDFANAPLGTCMDYSNDATPNQWPNRHDYTQLQSIYWHLDNKTTVQRITAAADETTLAGSTDFSDKNEWGRLVSDTAGTSIAAEKKDHHASYERNFGNGKKLFTDVIWVQE